MTPAKIIEWALQALELAFSLLSPNDQERLAQRLDEVNAAKRRVRERAQAALDKRKARK